MDPNELPDESEELKRLLLKMHGRVTSAEDRATSTEAQNAALRLALADVEQALAALKKRTFGRRTERIDDRQLSLLGESEDPKGALEAATEATSGQPESPRSKRLSKHGRRKLPSHLKRIQICSKETGPTHCQGCSGELKIIGSDVSERLEYIPGHFVVYECSRTKRVCPRCPSQGVITQPAPAFGLDRALPADGLLAKIITDKFADHLPLTRQSKRFRREGSVDIAVSTICGWLRQSAALLGHVVDAIADELLAGDFIQSDATGLPILEGNKNQPRRGHLWSYSDGEQVVFKSTMDGKQAHPADFLEGFSGTLLTDGAGAYNLIATSQGVIRAGCWAHARRKFFEARTEAPEEAGFALVQIRDIFGLERRTKTLGPEARAKIRTETLAQPLQHFKEWLDTQSTSTRPKSALGKAVTYARNQWDTLVVFLERGQIPVHNNASERQLRGPVIGRKNWMFAGSEGGAKTAATCFTIVGSCVLAGVDPYEYLRDVMSLLPDATPEQLKELTPRASAKRFGTLTE